MSKDIVDIIVKVKYVFTMNSRREIIVDGAVAINGNKIVAVGKASDIEAKFRGETVLSYRKAAILPGLVDAHVHNAQTLLRGAITDYEISIPPFG